VRRRVLPLVVLLLALAALAVARASSAAGPSLPAIDGGTGIATLDGTVRYVARLRGTATQLRQRTDGGTARTVSLPGGWGIQLATLDGGLTGLSPNGRVLVLSDNVHPGGTLRPRSRFAVIDTEKLAVTKQIGLRGDFSVDALSPRGDLLYLIHHLSQDGAAKYQVRAYDLRAGRLLPGVIADKRQAGWLMAGFPVARATGRDGGWVYTLYRQDDNYPFVHALDTVHRTAVCIGIPANWTSDQTWLSSARLTLASGTLAIATSSGKTRFLLDTKTFRLTTP
jgi:hypothetical protein